MKKLLTIIFVIVTACAVLCGCNPDEKTETPYEVLEREYAQLATAKSIEQNVEIKTGEMVQYTRGRTYTKTETGYSVAETERRLNELTPETEKAYSETSRTYEVESVEEFSMPINLDDETAFEEYTIDATHLSCKVKDEKIKEVTSLTDEDIPAPISGMTIEIEFGEHVDGLTIEYVSGGSHVTITISAIY